MKKSAKPHKKKRNVLTHWNKDGDDDVFQPEPDVDIRNLFSSRSKDSNRLRTRDTTGDGGDTAGEGGACDKKPNRESRSGGTAGHEYVIMSDIDSDGPTLPLDVDGKDFLPVPLAFHIPKGGRGG